MFRKQVSSDSSRNIAYRGCCDKGKMKALIGRQGKLVIKMLYFRGKVFGHDGGEGSIF